MTVKSPSTLILGISSVRSSELVSMTVCGALVVPIVCSPKVRDMGESFTDDGSAVPFPFSDILIGSASPSWNMEATPDAGPGHRRVKYHLNPADLIFRQSGGRGGTVGCLLERTAYFNLVDSRRRHARAEQCDGLRIAWFSDLYIAKRKRVGPDDEG